MKKELVEVKDQLPALTADDVRKFFCEKATEKEIALFLNIAKLNNLNPFNREIYIVKYGSYPASILTGYEVYLKRAERSGKYAGFKAWIEGEIVNGNMKACIEVPRKDWDKPLYHEVEYSEYVGKTSAGIPTRFWKDKPKTMLKKVVISQAFRFAFPDELSGLPYTDQSEETNHSSIVEQANEGKSITIPTMAIESHQDAVNSPNLNEATKDEEIPFGDDLGSNTSSGVPDYANKNISAAQRKRLFVIAGQAGWTKEGIKDYLKISHNIESTKDIPQGMKYEGIINFLSQPKDKQ